jgi:hypothetical protein
MMEKGLTKRRSELVNGRLGSKACIPFRMPPTRYPSPAFGAARGRSLSLSLSYVTHSIVQTARASGYVSDPMTIHFPKQKILPGSDIGQYSAIAQYTALVEGYEGTTSCIRDNPIL